MIIFAQSTWSISIQWAFNLKKDSWLLVSRTCIKKDRRVVEKEDEYPKCIYVKLHREMDITRDSIGNDAKFRKVDRITRSWKKFVQKMEPKHTNLYHLYSDVQRCIYVCMCLNWMVFAGSKGMCRNVTKNIWKGKGNRNSCWPTWTRKKRWTCFRHRASGPSVWTSLGPTDKSFFTNISRFTPPTCSG